jgi:hypothetical protein
MPFQTIPLKRKQLKTKCGYKECIIVFTSPFPLSLPPIDQFSILAIMDEGT